MDEKANAVMKQFLEMEHSLRDYHKLWTESTKIQEELLSRLMTLSKRYAILRRRETSIPFLLLHGDISEGAILNEFNQKMSHLRLSVGLLACRLKSLQFSWKNVEDSMTELDVSSESQIIQEVHHRPLQFFIEFICDSLKYFLHKIVKFEYCAGELNPRNITAMEQYKFYLEPHKEFNEYFMLGLSYFKTIKHKPST